MSDVRVRHVTLVFRDAVASCPTATRILVCRVSAVRFIHTRNYSRDSNYDSNYDLLAETYLASYRVSEDPWSHYESR